MKRAAELGFVILFSPLTLAVFVARMGWACAMNGWVLAGEFLES